jgi:hypothetical protein
MYHRCNEVAEPFQRFNTHNGGRLNLYVSGLVWYQGLTPKLSQEKPMERFARIFVLLLAFLILPYSGSAQTTELTYQGQLQSSSAPASGSFDFEFALFDAGGTQIGPVLPRSGVAVANGIFSVNLDFGSSFPGATRFLEIRVRPSGAGPFTTLSPRQPLTSTPYAVKSLNAENAANFTGSLNGDVTGTQGATTVARLQNRNVAATAPSGGQVLKFNAAANQWQPDTDSSGVGGSGATNTIPVWSSDNTLGNSLITQSAAGVQLPNNVQLAAGPHGNSLTFGSPNGETGIQWRVRLDGRI